MTQFPSFRQPALGIQDAAMLPAQSAGNLLIQRLAAAEAAFVPTTQTFDSTTSSTALNSTVASSTGGSLRSLMIPIDTANFVDVAPTPSLTNQLLSQFAAATGIQTSQGSVAGRAVFGAGGVELPGIGGQGCGCRCVRELSEEVVIDEENTNGIDDSGLEAASVSASASAKAAATVAAANVQTAAAAAATDTQAAAPAANIQYVTYNA